MSWARALVSLLTLRWFLRWIAPDGRDEPGHHDHRHGEPSCDPDANETIDGEDDLDEGFDEDMDLALMDEEMDLF